MYTYQTNAKPIKVEVKEDPSDKFSAVKLTISDEAKLLSRQMNLATVGREKI
jgi:hypothetical protein